ncbi:GNAT family N-acetyltransferase [Microbacterium flavum]|uniref:GNAT family N-acetyltransferase n=2 Tax=Microbacterium flavum TaxID=415216 RepID=UPI003D15E7DC
MPMLGRRALVARRSCRSTMWSCVYSCSRVAPVGIQSASGDDWAVLREVETGSWLGHAHQGRGIGRRMRALMLTFCFEALKADSVVSTAFTDNVASNAVSLRTGYQVDGIQRVVRDDRFHAESCTSQTTCPRCVHPDIPRPGRA